MSNFSRFSRYFPDFIMYSLYIIKVLSDELVYLHMSTQKALLECRDVYEGGIESEIIKLFEKYTFNRK